MIYALLVPESMTAWAMRQYFGARWIAKEYNESVVKNRPPAHSLIEMFKISVDQWFHKKPLPLLSKKKSVQLGTWTTTHGFFVQMGGFMLCEDGRPYQTLDYCNRQQAYRSNMGYLIEKGVIDPPTITEAEIKDRSKGDFLSKAVVVLQTTWFIAQCITRWSANLPVTELEIVTLGFAMLNALTYALWWNKPQSIGLPTYPQIKKIMEEEGVQCVIEDGSEETEALHLPVREASKPASALLVATLHSGNQEFPTAKVSFLKRKLQEESWSIPYRLVQATLRPLSRVLQFSETRVHDGELRVAMFYSSSAEDATVFVASSIIGCLFGMIHLIPAWSLEFPSRPEMVLWRIFATVITVQPTILCSWATVNRRKDYNQRRETSSLFTAIALLGIPLYIVARLSLLILAFLSLRTLPPKAFISIEWMSFVPHL